MNHEQGSFGQFRNRLRILINIDAAEFYVATGEGEAAWGAFRDNPWAWFIRASDKAAGGLFEVIRLREAEAAMRGPAGAAATFE